MFDKQQEYGTLYKMDIVLRPNGRADMAYLSGFADCLAASLKVNYGAVSRKFAKAQGCLVVHLQINDNHGPESDTAQYIVDTIERASMKQEDCKIFIDGKEITLEVEKPYVVKS